MKDRQHSHLLIDTMHSQAHGGEKNRLSRTFLNQKGFQIWLCAPTQHSGQVYAKLLAHGSDIWPWEIMAAIFMLCFSIWYDTFYASLCTRVGQSYSWPVLAGRRQDGVPNRLKWKTSCTLSLMTFSFKKMPLCERLAHRLQRYSPLRRWKKKKPQCNKDLHIWLIISSGVLLFLSKYSSRQCL